MEAFGWAFIGTGAIANTVAKEITATARHRIVSCYSRNTKTSSKFANKYNSYNATSFEDAVMHEGVNAVYLATPHSCHYGEIMKCIELGIPVLSEKAFTINAQQTEAIINTPRRSYVSEGMWTRYNPIVRQVRELVASGKLGKIKSVEASFCYPFALSNFSKRVVLPEYGGGALLDIGVYLISYMNMLFGKAKSVQSNMIFNKYGTDKFVDMHLEYDGGVSVHAKAGLDRLTSCGIKIIGDKGNIHMPLFYRPTSCKINIEGRKYSIYCTKGYIHEFDYVAGEIREGKVESSLISLQDSLEVMRVMDEIRREHNLDYPEEIETININK